MADLGLENGGFSVEWARLRAREFLKTTPTSGQNLVYFALNFLFACQLTTALQVVNEGQPLVMLCKLNSS